MALHDSSRSAGLSPRLSSLLIILAGCCWGTTGLFVRNLTAAGLSSQQISMMRTVFSFLIFLVIVLIKDPKLLRIQWRDIWCFLGTGVCSLTFFNVCYFTTINLTSLSTAAVLLYTEPAILMLLSAPLFHEKLTGRKITALLLTLCGCVFVTGVLTDAPALTVGGILTGLGAGFGYALYSVFSRYAFNRGYDSLTINVYTFLFSTLSLLPFCRPGALFGMMADGSMPWLVCFLQALASTVLPYLLYTIGLKAVDNGPASIMASTEPVVATILSVTVLQEPMTWMSALGVVLVIGAIVLLNVEKKPKKA